MNYREYQQISRRKSRQISVGNVKVGGDAPISVQTMTNTLTTDIDGTVAQILRAEAAGVDIVRVSCPDEESTAALKHIVRQVKVPIVADIHFHYKRAIEAAKAGAACLRINPGNIGSSPPGGGGGKGGPAPRGARGGQGRPRPRLCDPHRRQRRLAGTGPAGEVRRALPGRDGGERPLPRQ